MIKGILYSLIGVALFCTTTSIAEDPPHCHKVGSDEILGCEDRYADPNHVPSSNGCSTPDWAGDLSNWNNKFKNACDNHDICYDTCLSKKKVCDKIFLSELFAICNGNVKCSIVAKSYYTGVLLGGQSRFEMAQANACCCPQN